MSAALEAWDELRRGNERFCEGLGGKVLSAVSSAERERLSRGQTPIAMVVACADSRSAPELIFDQGLGQLFTIRVAGQVLAPPQLASLEFAATSLGTRLIVVLGHSGCGAVRATLDAMDQGITPESPHLASLVEALRRPLEASGASQARDQGEREAEAIAANARWVAQSILAESSVLRSLVDSDGLMVKSAFHDLYSGVVAELRAPQD